MVGDVNDHTLGLIGRKTLYHFLHCMPMVDDLLKGLHVERDFFINYSTGREESLHILV